MSKNENRDNFSSKVKEELAKRVAFLCSNPKCRRKTIGPKESSEGSVSIGVACHIFAAAPKGPRANQDLSSDERSSIDNGIWLCSNCSALIDKDPGAYPPDLLLKWKQDAEQRALSQLKNNSPSTYHQEETRKSINYNLIDEAILKVINDNQLIDFLRNHDFNQPYYYPMVSKLYDLLDIIEIHSDDGSPYDDLYRAIKSLKIYLALNAFDDDPYRQLFYLGKGRNPEDPHNLAIKVAEELRKI